jgi:hypothetical protein
MISRLYNLFNSNSFFVKYLSIITFVSLLLFILYFFLDPELKQIFDGFILRIALYSKLQLLLIFKLVLKESLSFFWGIFIMQFWYGFILGGIKKFFLMSFSSKFLLLVASLGKRYLIDNVIMVSLNNNFIYHIKRPIYNLIFHYLEIVKDFSLKKKIAIWAGAIGIPLIIITPVLYFIGIFTFILEKVFSANMWKAMLIWILKFVGVFLTFFSNIWDSWFAPIIEVLLFTWILGILEKVPFIKRIIRPIYILFNRFIRRVKRFLNKYFHSKIKRTFGNAIHKINYHIDITILKSQNEKMLENRTFREQKAIQSFYKSTTKNKRTYTFYKRMNAHFINKNTQNRKYFGSINKRRILKVKNKELKVRNRTIIS